MLSVKLLLLYRCVVETTVEFIDDEEGFQLILNPDFSLVPRVLKTKLLVNTWLRM